MSKDGFGKGLALIMTAALSTGCDEQKPSIALSNAVEVASCALSVANIHSVIALASTLGSQVSGQCPLGGVILRDDGDPDNISIVADHCITAENTKLQGRFSEAVFSRAPEALAWTFGRIAISDEDSSSAVHGAVVFQENETSTDYVQSLDVTKLELSQQQTVYQYGATALSARFSIASKDAFVDYDSTVEQCGEDTFNLQVRTTQSMHTLPSDSAPISGALLATAADGSSLSLQIADEFLLLSIDSNADGVDDQAMQASWREIDDASVASRKSDAPQPRLLPFIWKENP